MPFSTPLALLLAAPLELSPGTRYDPGLPPLQAVVGHEPGQEITSPEDVLAYMRALVAAAPDRTRLVQYATSWEGRPLHALIVGSRERMARLDATKADLRRLADPRTLPPAEAERLVRDLPVVTWLVHGVHGNEISSADAALYEAYHLLAAQGDTDVDLVRRESLVLIDPMQNPDGRARFLFQNRLGRAAAPDPEPASAEHDEPWPGGRSNHYLFDLNRDWFAMTQPESVGRVRFYLEWFPQVAVDLHEMGGDSTYYFPPSADPANPWRTAPQTAWLSTFGRANAARFDARGFSYFIREVFDAFYPGYGTSWPMAQGAIGKTFEMASARGLEFRRRDETVLTYLDGVVRHFTAALQTAVTAARNREKLLRDFLEFRRGEAGDRAVAREYVLVSGPDSPRAERLVRILVAQGIEVRRAEEPVAVGARRLPAGSFLVSLTQPGGRLARNLLDAQAPMSEAFVKEQDRRRKLRLPDQIYDVTAWSLPLFFDVECVAADRPPPVRAAPVVAGGAVPPPALPAAKVAYLLPWGVGTAAAVVEALQSGLRLRTADRPFTLAGRAYPAATAIARVSDNGPDLRDRLAALAARHGAEVAAADTGWVDDGLSLGSNQVVPLKAPRVLLLWDAPTQSLSAGWTRYVLERRYGQPVTAVRVASLRRVDLRRFDVVVVPSGSYENTLNDEAVRLLKDWVRAGGTLVTMAESSRWAAREKVGLLETRTELRNGQPETEPSEKEKEAKKDSRLPEGPFDLDQAIQPEKERPELVPGALLRVILDPEHWLSAGSDGEVQAMVEGQRVFTPIKLDKGRNVGLYAARDRLVASGVVWPESQEQLARKAYLVHQPLGEGHVVAFAEEPNFRAYAEATELLFINAVVLGPAH